MYTDRERESGKDVRPIMGGNVRGMKIYEDVKAEKKMLVLRALGTTALSEVIGSYQAMNTVTAWLARPNVAQLGG